MPNTTDNWNIVTSYDITYHYKSGSRIVDTIYIYIGKVEDQFVLVESKEKVYKPYSCNFHSGPYKTKSAAIKVANQAAENQKGWSVYYEDE